MTFQKQQGTNSKIVPAMTWKREVSLLFHLVHFSLDLVGCEAVHQFDCFSCGRDLFLFC